MSKTRSILYGMRSGRQITKNFLGAIIANVDVTVRHSGLEKTTSSGHPISLLKRNNEWFTGDIGGPFTNQKVYLEEFSPVMSGSWSSGPWSFVRDGIVPVYFDSFIANSGSFGSLVSGNDLTYYGTKGWSQADPIRPNSHLFNALFELKEGIPLTHSFYTLKHLAEYWVQLYEQGRLKRLVRSSDLKYYIRLLRHVHSKKATPVQYARYQNLMKRHQIALAEGYLTWEFEWLPFVSDVQNFSRDVVNAHNNIEKVFLDSNMTSRRHVEVLSSKDTVNLIGPTAHYGAVPMITQAYFAPGILQGTQTTEKHFWFSGKFSWYVPPPRKSVMSQFSSYETALRRSFGLEITPRSLYASVPWTWLYDWCTDTSAIISNFTDLARDGLAANYAYIMAESTVTRKYNLSNLVFSNGTSVSGSQSLITRNKQRIAASPFGFAVSPSSFTDKQWNILSQLGISRGYHAV